MLQFGVSLDVLFLQLKPLFMLRYSQTNSYKITCNKGLLLKMRRK